MGFDPRKQARQKNGEFGPRLYGASPQDLEDTGIKITENVNTIDGYYDYCVEDETGTYGVEYEGPETETGTPYRTYILDPETKKPLADSGSTEEWPEFYKRGWTKKELHAGCREAWGLPINTGKEQSESGSTKGKQMTTSELGSFEACFGCHIEDMANLDPDNVLADNEHEMMVGLFSSRIIDHANAYLEPRGAWLFASGQIQQDTEAGPIDWGEFKNHMDGWEPDFDELEDAFSEDGA